FAKFVAVIHAHSGGAIQPSLLADEEVARVEPAATTAESTTTATRGAAATADSASAAGKSATAAHESKQVLEGEILLIDVVRKANRREATVSIEDVDVAAGDIALVGTVAAVDFPELTVTHAGAGDDVDRLLGVSVVEAGELGLVTLAIEYLDALDDVRRNVP